MLSLSPDWSSLAERDRRRPAAREERQAHLPRGRVVRVPPAQQPPGARRDRPARRRAHRPRQRRGDEARLQHRDVELRARGRALPTRGDDRLRARRRLRRGARVRREAAHAAVERPRRRRSPTRSSSRTAASTPRLPRLPCSRRTATASVTARRSPTASPGPRTSSRRSPARAARRSRSRAERSRPELHTLAWDGTIGGSPAPEGKWTFTVTGTDDRNVTTERAADVLARRHALVARRHDRPRRACRRRRSS